jgi:hypothetical protein
MPLKFNTANGAIIVTAEDGSGDAAVTFPRSNLVGEAHTGNVSITGDLTTTGTFDHTGNAVVSGSATMGSAIVSGEFIADSVNETYSALSGTAVTVNCETGNFFSLSTSGNTTFTFSNPPASGTAYSFTLRLTAGGTHTITYPASVDWAGGTAPDAPASGETDLLAFATHDGGTTWYGFLAGDAMA